MSSVTLKNISKSFGRVEVIGDFSLDIGHGEFVVFVGPSGCGKSTLLRMIAGLESISGGQLEIGGKSVNEVPAADRGIAMVFQSYALYPHMNVSQNIGFGLKMAGMSAADVARKVDEAAATLQITELLGRRPRELSGGQRQRVAIGRAIVKQPDVFLFDEPLSNLDADLRAQMRVEIARLHKLLGTTVIYVTHDQIEAMTLADRIVVLRDGTVEQVGTPDELYEKPANTFVAQFLGQPKMNLIPGRTRVADAGKRVEIAGNFSIDCPPLDGPVSDGDSITLGIRPGDVRIARQGAANAIEGKVDFVEHLGNEVLVHVGVEGIESGLVAILPKRADVMDDKPIWMTWERSEAHLFNAKGIKL